MAWWRSTSNLSAKDGEEEEEEEEGEDEARRPLSLSLPSLQWRAILRSRTGEQSPTRCSQTAAAARAEDILCAVGWLCLGRANWSGGDRHFFFLFFFSLYVLGTLTRLSSVLVFSLLSFSCPHRLRVRVCVRIGGAACSPSASILTTTRWCKLCSPEFATTRTRSPFSTPEVIYW